MKIVVIGQGYVGLTLAVYAASTYTVIGFDTNPKLVEALNSGYSHIEGISNSQIREKLALGSYAASSNPRDINGAEVVLIAVPTPLDKTRNPDLSFLDTACRLIATNLTNKALIINESTSFPGTVRNFIAPIIESISPGIHHFYAVSPERIDPGRSQFDPMNTSRLIAGLTPQATDKAIDFYSQFCTNVIRVETPEIAEMAKLFENSFRQVNIALVNELAQIAHAMKIPVREILAAASTKPYGFMKFEPSAGVGGHCIPIDPIYLSESARKYGVVSHFIELANQINLDMPRYVVDRVKEIADGDLVGKNVQIVGVSYKANVADLRETPADPIYNYLLAEKAKISWYDPLVNNWREGKSESLGSEIMIIVTLHDCIPINDLHNESAIIFDTTGKVPNAVQL
jgi:UDP-N-acetyl-D-glucosamine dehydrogenase